MGRPGIKEDLQEVAVFLEKYQLTTEQLSSVMLQIQDGMDPGEAAKKFVKNNRETVEKWIPKEKE